MLTFAQSHVFGGMKQGLVLQNGQASGDSKLCSSETLAACATEVRPALYRVAQVLELLQSSGTLVMQILQSGSAN